MEETANENASDQETVAAALPAAGLPAAGAAHDKATEMAAVRCALAEPELFGELLGPADFADPMLRKVWSAGRRLLAEGRAVGLDTLAEVLSAKGVANPWALLAGLAAGYASPIHFPTYAATLRRWSRYRALWAVWSRAGRAAPTDGPPDTDALLAELIAGLQRLAADPSADAGRFALLTAADALAPQPPLSWVVEGFIGSGTVNVLFGEPAVGKTWMFLDLAVAVATGATWAGLAVEGGPVLIVDEESGRRRLLDRLGRCLRGRDAGPQAPVYCVSLAGLNMLQQVDLAALRGLVERTAATLVVMDALADIALGADENSVQDMQPLMHGLRTVAEATGAAILIVHHARRVGGYRGSSAISGATDGMLELAAAKSGPTERELAVVKQRDGQPHTIGLSFCWTPDRFRVERGEAPAAPPETYSKGERCVLRLLSEGPATVKQIMDGADVVAAATAKNALYALVDRGKVRRKNAGGRGSEALFELVVAIQPGLL